MTEGKGKKSKSSWKSYTGSMKQPYGAKSYGYSAYSPPMYPPMMAQNPYAAMLPNLYGSMPPNQQVPMAFNPYYNSLVQQDATGTGAQVSPVDYIKNLIAVHAAAKKAKETAKTQPKSATGSPPSPEQVSALIKAFSQFVANRKAAESASKAEVPPSEADGPPTYSVEQVSALLDKLRDVIASHKAAEGKTKTTKVEAKDTFTENSNEDGKPSGSVKRDLSEVKPNDAVDSTTPETTPEPKKPNPAWPEIEKQLKALGIPITAPGTTPSPGDMMKLKTKFMSSLVGPGAPFWASFIKPKTSATASSGSATKPDLWAEFVKKYLSTASDPAMVAGYPSPWGAISKQLSSFGIPISPAASMTPSGWMNLKSSFMMPPATTGKTGAPFWTAFMKSKYPGAGTSMSDPPAYGSSGGSPFWASYIPSKTGFAPLQSAFIPPQVSSFIPPKGAFIPPSVSGFIPKGFAGGSAPWGAYMSDPPAAATTSQVPPPFWAAFMASKSALIPPKPAFFQPPGAATPPNPWAEFVKSMGTASSSSGTKASPIPAIPFWAAFMKPQVPPPPPAPKPNPWAEYFKSIFNTTSEASGSTTSNTVPFWAAFVKPKPAKPVKPNPWAAIMESYMSKPAPAVTSPVAVNPWLEFMKAMSKGTTQGTAPTSPEGVQVPNKGSTETNIPPSEMTDLWAEFIKSYVGTAGAASGTNPAADPPATFANPFMPGGVPMMPPSAWLNLKQKYMTSAVPGGAANPVGPFSGPADWLNVKDSMVKSFGAPSPYAFNIPASDPKTRGQAS